jgi:hypothetical protein
MQWKREIFSTMRKNFSLNSVGKDPNHWFKVGMVNCQICSCRLPEVASLGWFHVRLFANEPLKTIPRRRGMSGDQFRAMFGNFGGR